MANFRLDSAASIFVLVVILSVLVYYHIIDFSKSSDNSNTGNKSTKKDYVIIFDAMIQLDKIAAKQLDASAKESLINATAAAMAILRDDIKIFSKQHAAEECKQQGINGSDGEKGKEGEDEKEDGEEELGDDEGEDGEEESDDGGDESYGGRKLLVEASARSHEIGFSNISIVLHTHSVPLPKDVDPSSYGESLGSLLKADITNGSFVQRLAENPILVGAHATLLTFTSCYAPAGKSRVKRTKKKAHRPARKPTRTPPNDASHEESSQLLEPTLEPILKPTQTVPTIPSAPIVPTALNNPSIPTVATAPVLPTVVDHLPTISSTPLVPPIINIIPATIPAAIPAAIPTAYSSLIPVLEPVPVPTPLTLIPSKNSPSHHPTNHPPNQSHHPTNKPTETRKPTHKPTHKPTMSPTVISSNKPTLKPTLGRTLSKPTPTPTGTLSPTLPNNFLGTYGDGDDRAMALVDNGAHTFSYATCYQYAVANGYLYFGLQDATGPPFAQCSVSNDLMQATKYGNLDEDGQVISSVVSPVDNKVYAGGYANAIYFVTLPSSAPVLAPSVPTILKPMKTPPTHNPTNRPPNQSHRPTKRPTQTEKPTHKPTIAPTSSLEQSMEPTLIPTMEPILDPIMEPSLESTLIPTMDAIVDPTMEPTLESTLIPTMDDPIMEPTLESTLIPSMEPILDPIMEPTLESTLIPTMDSILDPIMEPTLESTLIPTMDAIVDPIMKILQPIPADGDPADVSKTTAAPSLRPTHHPNYTHKPTQSQRPTHSPNYTQKNPKTPTIPPTVIPTSISVGASADFSNEELGEGAIAKAISNSGVDYGLLFCVILIAVAFFAMMAVYVHRCKRQRGLLHNTSHFSYSSTSSIELPYVRVDTADTIA